MNIAFFDFDGTISKKDSLFVFVKFLVGKKKFYIGLLLHIHILVLYMLGVMKNNQAKQYLTQYFFKGYKKEDFLKKAQDFRPVLESIVKNSAIDRILWHKDRGDEVVVVSATFQEYLKFWCEKMDIKCIGTKLEVIEGILTGKFESKNCYGIEKVNRIKDNYDLSQYQEIYAYGDSRGDKEMLELATNSFYRYFK